MPVVIVEEQSVTAQCDVRDSGFVRLRYNENVATQPSCIKRSMSKQLIAADLAIEFENRSIGVLYSGFPKEQHHPCHNGASILCLRAK